MVKEGKEPNSEKCHQEELMESEFGFVYEFFISEKSNGTEKMPAREQPQGKKESELRFGDQSATFFLPDFFVDET